MVEHLLYIDGAWRPGRAGSAAAVSPSSGETFATVAVASPADVDDAYPMDTFTEPKTVTFPAPAGLA